MGWAAASHRNSPISQSGVLPFPPLERSWSGGRGSYLSTQGGRGEPGTFPGQLRPATGVSSLAAPKGPAEPSGRLFRSHRGPWSPSVLLSPVTPALRDVGPGASHVLTKGFWGKLQVQGRAGPGPRQGAGCRGRGVHPPCETRSYLDGASSGALAGRGAAGVGALPCVRVGLFVPRHPVAALWEGTERQSPQVKRVVCLDLQGHSPDLGFPLVTGAASQVPGSLVRCTRPERAGPGCTWAHACSRMLTGRPLEPGPCVPRDPQAVSLLRPLQTAELLPRCPARSRFHRTCPQATLEGQH